MILEYEYFTKKLNEKLFEGSSKDLLEKIAKNPDRYVGIFRPTTIRTKLIQNITQSHEIKFGDALEEIFEEYFEKLGFEILPKKLPEDETEDGKEYNIDQLFRKQNVVYLIEQKVRDDHDSTKKRGQFDNFERKYYEVSRTYPNCRVIHMMWFIDDSLKKNKKYYTGRMQKMKEKYGTLPKLYYGDELFLNNEDEVNKISIAMWNEVKEYLERWKETLPDMPEVNFDLNADEVFEEIKDIETKYYNRLFKNEKIVEQVLPIIFPTNVVLTKLREYFYSKSDKRAYKNLYKKVNDYLNNKVRLKPDLFN